MAHVRARVAPDEEALVRGILPGSAWGLFDGMPVADRRHALDVVEKLLAGGHDSPDVLAAALLHDVAKGRRMRLWHRVSGVLLGAVAPGLLRRLAVGDATSWRHPFWLYLHHGPMSADLAAAAGCSAVTARLIRGVPADAAESQLSRILEAADDAS